MGISQIALTPAERAKLATIEEGADDVNQAIVRAALAASSGAVAINGQSLTDVGLVDGRDVSADGTKLDGVEALADVTDEVNVTAAHPISDATALVKAAADDTKRMRLDVGAVAKNTTRVLTVPNQDVDLAPNTGTFPAASHADRHVTGGADKLRDATAAQDGLMTVAYAGKLEGVEADADVTDAANVAAAGAIMSGGTAGGGLSGTYPNPAVAALTTTTGPTSLVVGAVANGEFLKRIGSTLVGDVPAGGAALGWEVDTDSSLSEFLLEFWNFRGPGSVVAGGFTDVGVLGNWPVVQVGAVNEWARRNPRGGLRGSINISNSTTRYPRTTGTTTNFLPYGTKPFWFSLWFYPFDNDKHAMLVANAAGTTDRHFRISKFTDGVCYMVASTDGETEDGSVNSVGAVTLNAWNHIVAGFAGGGLFISLNGAARVDSAHTSISAAVSSRVTFGNYEVATGSELNGHLADIAVWVDTAVSPTLVKPTATQIASLYSGGTGNAFLRLE